MSVPVGKRKPSKVEFLNNFYRLRKDIVQLLLRDFGVKNTLRNLKTFSYAAKFSPEDEEVFNNLCTKYHIDVEAEYPLWLMEHYRERILKILYDTLDNIITANSIYPISEKEYEFRRQFQHKAISNCYQLLQVFQAAIQDLPVDANKYMPYVERIDNEITLLKNWKKAGNKILLAIQEKLKRESS